MFCTKNLISNYREVDPKWVYEFYCKLPDKLDGQDIKIRSVFNPDDKTPSLCIYYKDHKWRHKCFSSGHSGTCTDLVKQLFGVPFNKAADKIVEDYNQWILTNGEGYNPGSVKPHSKFKVTHHQVREWTTVDQRFWTQYNIGTRLLRQYNVRPLDYYEMEKPDKTADKITICGSKIYGYFQNDGTLYKVYQPEVREKKFIKVKPFLQGSEQLGNHKTLILASGLKDLMSLKSLGLDLSGICPDSENVMLSQEQVGLYREKYTILTLFDQDIAGQKASQKYLDTYSIKPVYLITPEPHIKDIADLVKIYGKKRSIEYLVPRIDQALNL